MGERKKISNVLASIGNNQKQSSAHRSRLFATLSSTSPLDADPNIGAIAQKVAAYPSSRSVQTGQADQTVHADTQTGQTRQTEQTDQADRPDRLTEQTKQTDLQDRLTRQTRLSDQTDQSVRADRPDRSDSLTRQTEQTDQSVRADRPASLSEQTDQTDLSSRHIEQTEQTDRTLRKLLPGVPKKRSKAEKNVMDFFKREGSCITSYAFISEETGVPFGTLRAILGRLEAEGFLRKEREGQGLKITVTAYGQAYGRQTRQTEQTDQADRPDRLIEQTSQTDQADRPSRLESVHSSSSIKKNINILSSSNPTFSLSVFTTTTTWDEDEYLAPWRKLNLQQHAAIALFERLLKRWPTLTEYAYYCSLVASAVHFEGGFAPSKTSHFPYFESVMMTKGSYAFPNGKAPWEEAYEAAKATLEQKEARKKSTQAMIDRIYMLDSQWERDRPLYKEALAFDLWMNGLKSNEREKILSEKKGTIADDVWLRHYWKMFVRTTKDESSHKE